MTATTTREQADTAAYEALQAAGGNASHAARDLGMARSTFVRAAAREAARREQAAQVVAAPVPPAGKCRCGCGADVASIFARGHETTYASALRAAYVAGEMSREQVLVTALATSERFHGKVLRMVQTADLARPQKWCRCGCGGQIPARQTFVQGHDNLYASALRTAYATGARPRDDVLAAALAISERFCGRVTRMVDRVDAASA